MINISKFWSSTQVDHIRALSYGHITRLKEGSQYQTKTPPADNECEYARSAAQRFNKSSKGGQDINPRERAQAIHKES